MSTSLIEVPDIKVDEIFLVDAFKLKYSFQGFLFDWYELSAIYHNHQQFKACFVES